MAEPNWANETMWTGDNLPIMRRMNSESVDLIYLDPPFNSNTDYAAPVGSQAAGAEFTDTWTLQDIDIAWLDLIEQKHPRVNRVIHAAMTDSDKSYLIYMAPRLLEMYRILKLTGSIYLHCDPKMSHYLKLLMDAIFGRSDNLRNEIIWHYSGWNAKLAASFNSRHDVVFYYSKSSNKRTVKFNSYTIPWASEDEYIKIRKQKVHVDQDGRKFVLSDAGSGNRVERYLSEAMAYGKPIDDVWDIDKLNNSSRESVGYPTQKPLALLDRIILASSNEGDVVLDPFCGCATACVAAHERNRQWIGIDISPKAFELVRRRIQERGGLFYNLIQRTDVPQRTDLGEIPAYNSAANRNKLYGEQGGDCAGCEEHFLPQNLTVDHIIARSVGGTDHIDNLQLLCGNCNSIKGNRGMEYLMARLQGV